MTATRTDVEFRSTVVKVEERFQKVYGEKFGEAKGESEADVQQVSTGWWVVLDGWPIAMRFGALKPDCDAGDTMIMEMHVLKK